MSARRAVQTRNFGALTIALYARATLLRPSLTISRTIAHNSLHPHRNRMWPDHAVCASDHPRAATSRPPPSPLTPPPPRSVRELREAVAARASAHAAEEAAEHPSGANMQQSSCAPGEVLLLCVDESSHEPPVRCPV